MNSKRHRQYRKGAEKKQGSSVSNEDSDSKKHDAYIAVWILMKLGWSNRRIAKLKLPTSHNTISSYLPEACELIGTGELTILPKVGWMKKVILAGKSDDVAYLYSKVHQNPCGGGKRGKRYYAEDSENQYSI